jgi:Flp pilus assembly protein TadG
MKIIRDESGQALIELTFVLMILSVLSFGVIEYGQAIYDAEVIRNLAGEGSAAASRGANLAKTVNNVVTYAGADISLNTKGCVIITSVTENAQGTGQVVTAQSEAGECTAAMISEVGCLNGQGKCTSSVASLPTDVANALASGVSGLTLYTTEVFYTYTPITPIPKLVGTNILPSILYAAAYY